MNKLWVLIILYLCSKECKADREFLESFGNVVRYAVDGSFDFSPPSFQEKSDFDDLWETFGNPQISTTSGDVLGSTLQEAHAFYSIPYAAPPIGDLRFRDPEPYPKSKLVINTTYPDQVVCHQPHRDECFAGYCVVNQNEDCLVLSIFVPRTTDMTVLPPVERLPVMLWIHGGAFFAGTGTTPKLDGRWLSNATHSIVITINYRVGAYGFLVYNKGEDHLKGNQGFKDQQMALRWVQDNIETFGGDKDRVTILGESAGAQSVMWHMLSGVSGQLYRRAILESNAAIFPHQTTAQAMDVTQRLLNHLECEGEDEFQCLLDAPTDKLDEVYYVMADSIIEDDAWSGIEPYRPIIDGEEFTDQPLELFQSGKWNTQREYIVGANTQEVEILQFYVPGNRGLPRAAFRKINTIFFGEEMGNKTADYYENLMEPDGKDYSKILGVEAGDVFFICPSRAMSRFAYDTALNPSGYYFYMFDQAPHGPYCHEVYPKNETCGYVYHSAEIPYVFRSGPAFGYYFDENEVIVSDQLSKYWGNFARNGDPNNDSGGPDFADFYQWKPYVKSITEESWTNIHIQAPVSCSDVRYKEEICDFWDSMNFYVQMKPENTNPSTTSIQTHITSGFNPLATDPPTTSIQTQTTSGFNPLATDPPTTSIQTQTTSGFNPLAIKKSFLLVISYALVKYML